MVPVVTAFAPCRSLPLADGVQDVSGLVESIGAHPHVSGDPVIALKSLLFRREWPYFYAFDLLAVDGEDLREWPLVERKQRLRKLIPSVPTRLLYVDHVEARGRDFFEVACAHDLEGIVV